MDFIEGIEVGVAKGEASRGGETSLLGLKSRGGRSGPLTGTVLAPPPATRGALLEVQQLLRVEGWVGRTLNR